MLNFNTFPIILALSLTTLFVVAGGGEVFDAHAQTITAPGSPTITGIVNGNAQATITWDAPSDNGGAQIRDYHIQYRQAGYSVLIPPNTRELHPWNLQPPVTGSTTTITNLSNGTSYEVRVRANNGTELGEWSDSAWLRPFTFSMPPGAITTTAGDGQVTLSWTAPASNGGFPIFQYVIEYSVTPEGVGTHYWLPFTGDDIPDDTSAVVTGLDNGTAYEFRVAARTHVQLLHADHNGANNYRGVSAWSPLSISTTPLGPPSAPTGLSATAGDGRVTLDWTAPSDTGGRAITSYVVQQRTGTTFANVPTSDITITGTRAVVTGLDNGASYDFRVAAVNSIGTGDYASVTVVLSSAPGTPTGLDATAGNAKVRLEWYAPAGTIPISDYIVQYKATSATQWRTFNDGTSLDTTATVTRLTNGISYDFQVAARNSEGTGDYSTAVSATPLTSESLPPTVPGIPTNLKTKSGDSQVTLTWSAPSNNGGSPITNYIVEYNTTDTNLIWNDVIRTGNPTRTTATITGLDNGTSYFFRVAAVNAVDAGAFIISDHIPVGVPGPVRDLKLTPGNNEVKLSWTAPVDSGASRITDYNIYYGIKDNAYRESTQFKENDISTRTTVTVDNLNNGTTYWFLVRAVNSVGENTTHYDPALLSDAAVGVPGKPTNLRASTPGDAKVTLTWRAPDSNGGAITDHAVEYRVSGTTTWNYFASPQPIKSTTVTIPGLDNVKYDFRIHAVNTFGAGAWSDHVSATPRGTAPPPEPEPEPEPTPISPSATVPAKVQGLVAHPGFTHVRIQWIAPNDGGTPITNYIMNFKNSVDTDWISISLGLVDPTRGDPPTGGVPVTLTDRSADYDFQIIAVNAKGNGPASDTLTITANLFQSWFPTVGTVP